MLRGMAIRMKEWGMLSYPRQSVHLTVNSLNDWGRSGASLGQGVAAAGHAAAELAEAMQRINRAGNEADISARLVEIGRETAEELGDKPVRDWDYSWQQAYTPRLQQLLSELEPDAREQARQMGAHYSRQQSLQSRRAYEVEHIRRARKKWSEQVESAVQRGDAAAARHWVEQGSQVFVPESELPQQLERVQSRSLCAGWQQQVLQNPAAALVAWQAPDAERPSAPEDLLRVQSGMDEARSRLASELAVQLAAAVEQGNEPGPELLQQAAVAGVLPPELAEAPPQAHHPLAADAVCRWLRRIDEREAGDDSRLVTEIALAPIPLSERRMLLQRVQATAALPPSQRAEASRVLWSLYHDGCFGCPGDTNALRSLGRLQDEALQRQQKSPDAKELNRWLESLRSSGENWLCFQPE